MEKISSKNVAAVLSTVPNMLRTLAQERDGLLEKNASLQAQVDEYERQKRVDTLAKEATHKHIDTLGETYEEKVATIEAALDKGKSLDVMEEAVKMSSLQGQFADLSSGDELAPADGRTELESYLLGQL